jgi:hypothetical protein
MAFSRPASGRIVWLAVALLVVSLQLVAIARQSLIGDAPHHLLAGYQALTWGQNTLNLEHPPLVKLLAALPLLAEHGPFESRADVSRALEISQSLFRDQELTQRVRVRSRLILFTVLTLPFLAVCFLLGRELGGARAGAVLAASLGLSLSVLPYLSLLQTDTAVSLGYVVTFLAVARFYRRPGILEALLLGLGFGLAMASKYSAVLLAPALVLTLALARGRSLGWQRRLGLSALAVFGAVSLGYVTYAIANRSYDAEAGRQAIRSYCRDHGTLVVEGRMERYEPLLLRLERFDPLLAQWLAGLIGIRIQDSIGVYPSYAFGSISSKGRSWFFPSVFLIKTPLAVLVATVLALWALGGAPFRAKASNPPTRGSTQVLGLTALIYLAAAMTSNYNLGVRHLLPILPLLYLPAALWAAQRPLRSAALVTVLAVEALCLSPLWISATNTWWLGSHNPTRFALSAGNNEFKQNFIALEEELRDRSIESIRILYPLVGEQEMRAYIPGAIAAKPGDDIEAGWYAVNVRVEQYIPAILAGSENRIYNYPQLLALAKSWKPYWDQVVRGEDLGYIAGTFHLYYLAAEPRPSPAS